MTPPLHDQPFTADEFAGRVERARALMRDSGLDALLVTSEANYRYLTGFISQFWLSPTRPWYFILPLAGDPVAVIPEVGVENMRTTSWVARLETWPSPRPEDEGVSLVAAILRDLPRRFGRIGAELGPESRLGIPAEDFLALRDRIAPLAFADAGGLLFRLRMVKSPAEIARIRFVCQTVGDGFDALPDGIVAGDTEASVCRRLHADLIARGVDKAPYLIGCSGPNGYRSAIMSPTERRLEAGDILVIDTGCTYDGYYCDFDRNWAFGSASEAARRAYAACWQATEAGIAAARPGARAVDLWRAQSAVLETVGTANVGSRMGHAIGLALTEPPSNKPGDDTVLVPGMVMTIEPGLVYADGRLMLHEENLVITEDGCTLLTRRAPPELPVVRL